MVFLILCDMLHWGKSLLLPLPLTRESFNDFMPNWDDLEILLLLLLLQSLSPYTSKGSTNKVV